MHVLIFDVCMDVRKGECQKIHRLGNWLSRHLKKEQQTLGKWGEMHMTWNQKSTGWVRGGGRVSKRNKRIYLKNYTMKYLDFIFGSLFFKKVPRKVLEINIVRNENLAISFPWEKKSKRIILRYREVHSRTFYDICGSLGEKAGNENTQNITFCHVLQLTQWPFGHLRMLWDSCLQTPFLPGITGAAST